MRRSGLVAAGLLCLALVGCGAGKAPGQAGAALRGPIAVSLDLGKPANSTGVLQRGDQRTTFTVGYGRNGVTCAGSRFEEGYTPLGRFRVNAILSRDRFVMDPALIAKSGKTEAELKATLFRNMNAIDFDGDQQRGEYGIGYISLAPVGGVSQPFEFNTYNGTFRWYSFAIHGSNNDQRIGQRVTGGCLNVTEPVLRQLLAVVKLGDEVVVSANGPCTP
ncbi:MAG: L,D-transpeptidase family protein [Cyanobacteriota bacterium]|nr:L,D-transpeptidase family protein [Cyanobacteriota bacterium]